MEPANITLWNFIPSFSFSTRKLAAWSGLCLWVLLHLASAPTALAHSDSPRAESAREWQQSRVVRPATPVILKDCTNCDPKSLCPDDRHPRIALALAGGGARALAHVGVLRALEELEIPIDLVCGTSMGAVVGGLWSMGWSAQEVDSLMNSLDWSDYFKDQPKHRQLTGNARFWDAPELLTMRWQHDRFLPPSALVKGQKVELLLDDLTLGYHGHQDFMYLPRSFACVATDIEHGELVYLLHGELATALRASMSLPSVFEPVLHEGRVLVDGGLLENLPTDLAKELGAEMIIAVNIPVLLKPYEEMHNLIEVADQSRQIIALPQERRMANQADVLLEPDVAALGALAFDRTRELMQRGYEATMAKADELLQLKDQLQKQSPSCLWKAGRACSRLPQTMRLTELRVEGSSALTLEQTESILDVRVGDSFNPKEISDRVSAFVAGGIASRAGYQIQMIDETSHGSQSSEQEPTTEQLPAARLLLEVDECPEVDLDLLASYNDTDRGVFGFRLNWPEIHGPGSMMRLDTRLSGRTELAVDYWKSTFMNRGLYLHPRVFYKNQRVYLADDQGNRRVSYRDYRWGGSIGMGLVLRRGARFELGFSVDHAYSNPDIGDATWQSLRTSFSHYYLRFETDTRNALDFPTRGIASTVNYQQFTNWFDETEAFTRWQAKAHFYHSLGTTPSSRHRKRHLDYGRGLLVFEGGVAAAKAPDSNLPDQKHFAWGAWPHMPGYGSGERWVDAYATSWLGSRLWFNSNLSVMPLVAWGWSEGDFLDSIAGSTVEADQGTDIALGLEVAFRTFLGPLRFRIATLNGHEPDLSLRLGWD
jgi:NTE family protein